MSEGNKSDDNSTNIDESRSSRGLGSGFLIVAGVAAVIVAIPLGIYALWSSNSKQKPPLEVSARHVIKKPDDEEDRVRLLHRRDTPLSPRITKPDQLGWVKLNVSSSRDHKPPSAGCGGVLRDPSGTWLIGFAHKMDPSYEDHVTAIEAILKGVELALEMNVKELVVESDNKSAVFLVESGVGTKYNNLPPYNSISRIRQLLLDPKWKVKVVHISREVNRVANTIARDACSLPFQYLRKYPYPPANCTTLLQEDAKACISP